MIGPLFVPQKSKPLWNPRFQRGFVRAAGLSRGLLGQRRSNLVLHAEGRKSIRTWCYMRKGKKAFEPGVTFGRTPFGPFRSEKDALRRSCIRCLRVLRRPLWSDMWSLRRTPVGRLPKPPHGCVVSATLPRGIVKSEAGSPGIDLLEYQAQTPCQKLRRSRQRLPDRHRSTVLWMEIFSMQSVKRIPYPFL